MVRDQERDKTLQRIWHQYQENEEDVSQHQTAEEGMCAMQIAISLRGSSRNNQNKGWEDTRQMQETATPKAENKVMRAGMCNPGRARLQGLYAHHETPERAP